jgi:hypothetical protein
MYHTVRTITHIVGMCAVVVSLGQAHSAHAVEEGGFTLTVTPPLFQLGLTPGEVWSSNIQVVNPNPYDITILAEPVLFRQIGGQESGRPEFYLPGKNGEEPASNTLADWITVPTQAVSIRREQTYTLPIVINVPENAPPGGHYAAILIGNRPPEEPVEGGTVSVTSSIAALVFLRVAGEVNELGRIREFSTERSIYEEALARFSLRFENQGNVHLQPQGDITIYNMFGKKRGFIPINQGNNGYGNVLPNTIREFTFMWDSDAGLWDIGRYRAEATIGYGENEKQFTTSAVYFYVLPFRPLLQVLSGVLALLFFIGWALRLYVRRALAIEQARFRVASLPSTPAEVPRQSITYGDAPRLKLTTLVRPIQTGIVDLRRATGAQHASSTYVSSAEQSHELFSAGSFMREYKLFFVFIGMSAVGWFAVSAYFEDVLTYERPFTAVEERPDGAVIPLGSINTESIDE